MNRCGLIFRLILVGALVTAISWFACHHEFLEAARLERELQRFGRWAPLLFVGLYALSTVLFVPGSVLTVVGGALFGPVWGTLWNLTGATLGATFAFLTARYVASDWVSRTAGERLTRVIRGVEEEGWRFVAFVRLVGLFPFNLVNYAFGLTRIRLAESMGRVDSPETQNGAFSEDIPTLQGHVDDLAEPRLSPRSTMMPQVSTAAPRPTFFSPRGAPWRRRTLSGIQKW
jgi:hypothetical protein